MRRIGKAHILGVGILTPALTGAPNPAAARLADVDVIYTTEPLSVSARDAAIWSLQESLFTLTQAQKLEIGGDRIRVAATILGTKESATKAGPQGAVALSKKSKRCGHKNSVKGCKRTATC